ncbi:tRNA lysidine(34) synthetase TilS [Salinicoccus sp. YB14-2]|uniref:tRNA lysidine(34) synthetase TilS n=1 Tax=Salinicoccus sp. YB14-2 TaxID=1572701 RepID=UPI00068D8579|nr:tRNA lysidine(34) synthetase TilS [Salinicoccus sp. YB14-2]
MLEGRFKLANIKWQKSDTVALAISGGMDSMVLYHQLTHEYRNTYQKLVLFHVNHGVRKESEEEEQYIKQLAKENDHTVAVKHLSMGGEFSQGKAREMRYRFFADEYKACGADVLLTAHHKDDHFETVLHQLLTNRHLNRTLGIKEDNVINDMAVARPLLNLLKVDIRRYQQRYNVHYFEDATNAEDDYTRNYIRHHIAGNIKENENLHEESLSQVADDFDALKQLANIKASEFLDRSSDGMFSRRAFQKQSHIIKVFILKKWMNCRNVTPSRKFIEETINIIQSELPQTDLSIGNKRIMLRYDDVYIDNAEEYNVKSTDKSFLISHSGRYFFNGHRLDVELPEDMLPLTVRSKADGDVIRLPHVGTKKISRVFIDEKIPVEERRKIPLIINKSNEVIALGTIYNIIKPRENYKGLNISKE